MLARSTTRYLSCAVALRAATVASFAPAPPASSRVLRRAAMSAMATVPVGRPSWQQTMLRVKDPVKSLAFYRDTLGMTLVDVLKFPQFDFDLYFLTTLPEGEAYPHEPGTAAAHNYLWSMKGATLELTHNYGELGAPAARLVSALTTPPAQAPRPTRTSRTTRATARRTASATWPSTWTTCA